MYVLKSIYYKKSNQTLGRRDHFVYDLKLRSNFNNR